MQNYSFPTHITFGSGAIDTLGELLQSNQIQKPLIVTDPTLRTLPMFEAVVTRLSQAGITAAVFADIAKNPVKSNVLNGAQHYHDDQCDAVIGFGGGASLDVARSIALKINHTRDLFDYEDAKDGWQLVENDIPFFVAIPTTSGTGSEVGRSAVISDDETHQKKILFSPKLMAQHVIADPALTVDLPAPITAAVGIDALTHNIEAYVAKDEHPLCDGIAAEGIRLIFDNLRTAVHTPHDMDARGHMMAAAMMGAVAFQKGLGVVHSCAHALSTVKDIHHGLANALMLLPCLEFNKGIVAERFEQLAWTLRLDDRSADGFIAQVKHLLSQIDIELGLGKHGVSSEEIPALVDVAIDDVCHQCNPRTVSREDFTNLFEAAL